MPKFMEYNPEQAYLLPPRVADALGANHLCFLVHRAVEGLDLSGFEQAYADDGRPAYHPALPLKVWLYAYALGMTSARRLEERVREDLALRYLAAGAAPDFWNLIGLEQRAIEGYVPDSHLGRELNRGVRVRGHPAARHPAQRRMRQKLRDPAGRAIYQRRKSTVEPVIGVLKAQRGLARFRYRGLPKVAVEWALATTAYNLTPLWRSAA